MKNHLFFVTTNTGKFEEVKRWIAELDPTIVLEQAPLEVPEIQSLDVQEVAHHKARAAWDMLQKPLLIDDGGLYLEQFHNFPGPLSKFVYQGIGLAGVWKLAANDPRAYFMNYLVFIDGSTSLHAFKGIARGHIIEPAALLDPVLPYTSIFMPEGADRVLAQMRGTNEEKKYHHRLQSVKAFLAWYKSNK